MKNLFLFTLITFFAIAKQSVMAQASKKTAQLVVLDKSINKIKIDVPSNQIEILHIKGSRINIETTVRLSSGSLAQLEYMTKSGRYDLDVATNKATSTLSLSPNYNNKVIIVRGEEIKETVTYTIYVPDHVLFVETSDGEQIDGLSSNE